MKWPELTKEQTRNDQSSLNGNMIQFNEMTSQPTKQVQINHMIGLLWDLKSP